jgi:hypothetical protein
VSHVPFWSMCLVDSAAEGKVMDVLVMVQKTEGGRACPGAEPRVGMGRALERGERGLS